MRLIEDEIKELIRSMVWLFTGPEFNGHNRGWGLHNIDDPLINHAVPEYRYHPNPDYYSDGLEAWGLTNI